MNKLTPAMERAMHQLTGTTTGRIVSGEGVALVTARALHRRGLAHLETDAQGKRWNLVLVEPAVREISDEQLQEMSRDESAILTPLTPVHRYRVRRYAHIRMAQADPGRVYASDDTMYIAVLHVRADRTYRWQTGAISERAYMQDRDLAGEQWKAAGRTPVDVWEILDRHRNAVMVVPGSSREDAHAQAGSLIEADPVGYREVVDGYGSRRLTLAELTQYLRRNGLAHL
ncbi:MAG TPA: hypothetical protein VIM84_03675 [Gemmatimonadales bacterium]